MIVQPTNFAALTWAGAAAGTLSSDWRIGSVLPARRLALLDASRALLRVAGASVEADVPDAQSLPPQFQVRVVSNGRTPVLEVLDAATPSPLHIALRATLPRQAGYAPLLASFAALARLPQVRALPAPARLALAAFESSVPAPADLSTGDGLRQALAGSGLFYENHLLQVANGRPQAMTPLLHDFKAALMRLVQTLGATRTALAAAPEATARTASRADDGHASPGHAIDTPPPLPSRPLHIQPRATAGTRLGLPDLLQDVHDHAAAALARVEIAQMSSHPALNPGLWLLDLPVRGEGGYDIVQMRVEKEPGAGAETMDTDENKSWALDFALELPGLGPLQAQIRLHAQQVQIRLWAGREASAERLDAASTRLAAMLSASGLHLQQWQCQHGLPVANAPLNRPLLDANA